MLWNVTIEKDSFLLYFKIAFIYAMAELNIQQP